MSYLGISASTPLAAAVLRAAVLTAVVLLAAVLTAALLPAMQSAIAQQAPGAQPAAIAHPASGAATAPLYVSNPQRAWQNWTLNCQGCHRPDGTGSSGTAPSIAGTVSQFLTVAGGREYLGRVPGVATSRLSDADLADLMNWMFWRFDNAHLTQDFQPFTAAEIGRLRTQPLRLEASQMRAALLQKVDTEPRAP